MKFYNYINESVNYNKLLKILKDYREEEVKIHEYPTMDAVIDQIERIYNEKNKKKIKELTQNFDTYCKLGIGWEIRNMSGSEKIIRLAYDFIMEKRKSAFPKYKLTVVNELIKYFEEQVKTAKSNKFSSGTIALFEQALNIFKDIKWMLDNPYIIGLEEESQFSTLSQEIKNDISFIKKKFKQNYNISQIEMIEKLSKNLIKKG